MKKIITIMFTLLMCMSLTTFFVGCSKEHTHTYSKEWSSDETNHYHAATCEHTDQVSDKAKHDFDQNNKCKVCYYENPLTLTAEKWDTEFNALANVSNASILIAATDGTNSMNDTLKFETNKFYYENIMNQEFYASFAENLGNNEFNSCFKNGVDGEYVSRPNSVAVDDWNDLVSQKEQYLTIAQFAAGKFNDTTYDSTTKKYSLVVGDAILDKVGNVKNLTYSAEFDGENLKNIHVEFKMEFSAENIISYSFDYTLGGVSITIPEVSSN